jgi:hypothetical protein
MKTMMTAQKTFLGKINATKNTVFYYTYLHNRGGCKSFGLWSLTVTTVVLPNNAQRGISKINDGCCIS